MTLSELPESDTRRENKNTELYEKEIKIKSDVSGAFRPAGFKFVTNERKLRFS